VNRREKSLAIAVGCLGAALAAVWLFHWLVLKPWREADRQTTSLRDRLRQVTEERQAFFKAQVYLEGVVTNTFHSDPEAAAAAAGKLLTDLISQLGLSDAQFTRIPSGPRRLRGAQEVGWTVQGEGPMARIVDLLFSLEQGAPVHRIDNLVLTAADRPGRIKARFRYLTLVVDPPPAAIPLDPAPEVAMDRSARRQYDLIVDRDLWRPYVRRAVAASEPSAPRSMPPPSAGSGPRLNLLKVVSLSEWRGVPEVHIFDTASMRVQRYRPGDELAGARIVMIDYRRRPRPDKPDLWSASRVILRWGSEYWAVEHGQTLADKHLLSPGDLPPDMPEA